MPIPVTTNARSPRLTAATRLGPYEIVAPLGAGGMGEVYRARDTRLEREVAVKVLPIGFADNESFRARFEREAKSISALNHPHICTIHDVGREKVNDSHVDYLVLELIEGESLADRIAKGPLPVAQVIEYGVQIASALDGAHRRGIVHRDLKPANVMITKSGAKLLDFGLARPGAQTAIVEAVSTFPTEDRPADRPLTEQGTIIGTFQYMAPEQLEGQPADARTDIFALGTLLYEMATGRKAFEGKTRTSLIAAIVSSQPPSISSISALSPPGLDHVVQKCLEKDPDDRWQSARDVAAEMEWIARDGSRAGVPAAVVLRRKNRERLAWGLCAILAATTVAFAAGYLRRAPRPAPVVRFTVAVPDELTSVGPPRLSPDGRAIAFSAADATGRARVWVRALDELHARALPGTDGVANRPFWSPDSRQIAFFADNKLKKVDLAGGPAQTVCDVTFGADGTWSPSGTILFDGRGGDPVYSVAATGGAPKPEVQQGAGLTSVGWPEFLPDGRHFLFLGWTSSNPEDETLFVGEVGAKTRKLLFKTISQVRYADPGYLVYVREQTLVAHPFDASRLEVTGEPLPIGDKLSIGNLGLGSFSVSRNGTLVFRTGEGQDSQFVWRDRKGGEAGVAAPPGIYREFAASPDGTRLAVELQQGANRDIWIRDLVRGALSRLTFHAAAESAPLWFPDGRRIIFASSRKGGGDLYVKGAAGTGAEEVLLESDEEKAPSDVSADGRWLLFTHRPRNTGDLDISALELSGERRVVRITSTPFNEWSPTFAPDARFLAYQSNETGRNEIYVQDFPEGQGRWQVSTAGGRHATWRADGREIFYLAPDGRLMSVPVEWKNGFTASQPEPLFQTRVLTGPARRHYQPAPDGQRFLVRTALGKDAIPPMTVVLNWPEAVRR